LSCLIYNQKCLDEETVITSLIVENDTQDILFDGVRKLSITASDVENKTVRVIVTEGLWPKLNQKGDVLQLYRWRYNLSVVSSCLMFADRVTIPSVLK
ncbi:unnamed protein product, partial [Hymenolepis diminuta]